MGYYGYVNVLTICDQLLSMDNMSSADAVVDAGATDTAGGIVSVGRLCEAEPKMEYFVSLVDRPWF